MTRGMFGGLLSSIQKNKINMQTFEGKPQVALPYLR